MTRLKHWIVVCEGSDGKKSPRSPYWSNKSSRTDAQLVQAVAERHWSQGTSATSHQWRCCSSDCSRATESYRNNLPQEEFEETLVGSVLLTNPHRLQWGTGFGLIYLENWTAYHLPVSRIKRCHLVKSLGRETIFKLGQFIRNTAQQHLKDAHPLKRESHLFC